jgi:outer membrane protein
MRIRYGLLAFIFGLSASLAEAQSINSLLTNVTDTISDLTDIMLPGVTNIRIGLGPVVTPAYEGSNDYKVRAAPLISLRYRDIVQVDNNNIRVNALGRDSFFQSDNFKAGPLVRLDFGRDESDSIDLTGLGNVGTSVELGLFVSYTVGPTRLRLRAQQDVVRGHSGMLVIGDLGVAIYRSDRLAVSGTLITIWADGDYMDAYFSVTAAQSLASSLAVFDTTSSLKDVSLAFGANYAVSDRWALVANAGYSKLLSDAKNSPIVAVQGSSDQFVAGIFAVYSF